MSNLRLFLSVMVAVLMTASFVLNPVIAQKPQPEPLILDATSATKGEKTVVYQTSPQKRNQRIDSMASEDILLIQTSDPWERSDHYVGNNWYDGVTADTLVLDSLGYSYRIATWSDIDNGSVNIFSYPVVLIVNDQVQAFYDDYAAHVSDFENYVSSGHTLLFFAASDGWAAGTLNANLPGGVQITTPWYESYNYIASANHPIVNAQLSNKVPLNNADLYSNYCSHGYFTALPGSATVILRESHNYPTLIEYRIGNGRVIASTQTWEHDWSYHTGGDQFGTFARKALDDVFLYAFSGGTVPADVKLDLRIEDAPNWISVNKSRGSFVDVVARITSNTVYQAGVALQIPANKLGLPVETFIRSDPGNAGGQSVNYTNLGGGRYVITNTLQALAGRYYKEFVWRFKVPDGASPEQGIELSATISVPGHTVQNPTSKAELNIIDQARSILVTNRTLLFSKYQPDPAQNDVSPLLEEVYIQAWAYEGEVFYVDLYNTAAKNWNQNVDYSSETTANTVSTAIDGLIDGWYNRLTKHFLLWETSKPEFLLIVGGDEIIPFYRADDRPYGDDEYNNVHIDDNDPVGKVPQQHYLLSDNIYADVGGGKNDWETGKLELSMGRIIGHSAMAMREFIESAWLETPALTHAVLASMGGSQVDGMLNRLNNRHVNIMGLNNPDMVDNDNWSRSDWLIAWQEDWQLNYYGGHGEYNKIPGPNSPGFNHTIAMNELPSGNIAQNHPLFIADACNLGIPTDGDGAIWNPEATDNVMYKMVSLGMGGMVASSGISSYMPDVGPIKIKAYGEALINDYVVHLVNTGSFLVPGNVYSEYFGTALLQSKRDYKPFLIGWNGADKKTIVEYVYYGLPWSFMSTPDNQSVQALAAQQEPKGYAFLNSTPEAVTSGSFSKIFTATVTSYQFIPIASFELLDVLGSDSLYSSFKPVLPVLYTTLNLPSGATVSGIELVNEHSAGLGQHNIPAADSATQYHPTIGYTSTIDVSGVYPPLPRYGYEVRALRDHVEVRIAIAPATFNVDTHEVTLYDTTTLRVNYNAPVPVVIDALTVDKPQYHAGEIITSSATIENVGANPVTLIGRVNAYNSAGVIVQTVTGSAFDLAGGDSHPVQIPLAPISDPDNYQLTFTVEQAGVPQVAATTAFELLAGHVTSFTVPESLGNGEYGNFSLSFANYRNVPITASAKVHVYDSYGIEVTNLLQRTFNVDANASGTTSWSWTPTGLPAGNYTMRAVVQVGDEPYTNRTYSLQVREPSRLFLPLVLRNYSSPIWTSTSGLTNRTIYALAPAPSNCSVVYAATDLGVYKSTDGGATWTASGLNALLAARALAADAPAFANGPATAMLISALAVDPLNSQIVYAGTWGNGVYKSTNGGAVWSPVNLGLSDSYIYALAMDPTNGAILYAGTNSGGVFKTINSGNTWTTANAGLSNPNIRTLIVAENNPAIVYAGTTSGVYRSTNNASSWAAASAVNAGNVWALASLDGQTVYAGVNGSGIYRTGNGGANWSLVNAGLTANDLRALVIDPTNSAMVYAATNSGGVFRTADSGSNWSSFNTGLGNWAVKSLTLSAGTCRTLQAGTANGVWRYQP